MVEESVGEHRGSQGAAGERSEAGAPPLAKVLANPWYARILRELTLRPMSIKGFVGEVGGSQSSIQRYFNQLLEWGFIEMVEMKSGGRRFGATERLYRAVARDVLDAEGWAALTQVEREAKSSNMIASYFQRVLDAVRAKTFDADLERHWSWDAVELDRTAFRELGSRLDEVLDLVPVLVAESEERLARSGEETVFTTVGLAAFRSPREAERRVTPEGGDPLPSQG